MQLRRRFCSIAAILTAVTVPGLAEGQAQQVATERITGEGGRYSVEMPAGYTSTFAPRPDGGTMRTISYLWKNTSGQYNVIALAVIDPPPGSTKHSDLWEGQRLIQARYPGNAFARAQEIQLGPVKGLSFSTIINSANNQGLHTIAFRIYALDGRLYEMLAETRTEDRDNPVVAAFMNSLRINR